MLDFRQKKRNLYFKKKKRGSHISARPSFLRSGKRDSNPRPSAWEADALPTELLPR